MDIDATKILGKMRLKSAKKPKIRIASLNSKFTGFYKKSVT